jgi:hypothetical protein
MAIMSKKASLAYYCGLQLHPCGKNLDRANDATRDCFEKSAVSILLDSSRTQLTELAGLIARSVY